MACPRRQLLPLCSIPTQMSRDGWAGANAHISLPFYDPLYYFFSGATFVPQNQYAPQSTQPFIGGVTKPNVGAPSVCGASV